MAFENQVPRDLRVRVSSVTQRSENYWLGQAAAFGGGCTLHVEIVRVLDTSDGLEPAPGADYEENEQRLDALYRICGDEMDPQQVDGIEGLVVVYMTPMG